MHEKVVAPLHLFSSRATLVCAGQRVIETSSS